MRHRHHSVLVLVLLTAACAATSNKATSSSAPKSATVDMSRAMRECREGRAARAALTEIFQRDQAVLDRGKERLMRQVGEIKASRDLGADVHEKEAALAADMAALQQQYRKLQSELKADEERRAQPIYQHLQVIMRRLAQARGIDIVERDPNVRPNSADPDLTDDLIRAAETE